MKIKLFVVSIGISIALLCPVIGKAQKDLFMNDKSHDFYPIPRPNPKMLFYLQRTHNTNTIVYEINYNKDSSLNKLDPVTIYWIRYDDNGEVLPLTSIQKKFAYGVHIKFLDDQKKTFQLNLTAYGKKDIYVSSPKKDNHYLAYTKINNSLSILNSIFIKTEGDSFWSPNVVYIELKGKNLQTGKIVMERFKP